MNTRDTLQMLDSHEPDETLSLKFPVETTIGAHGVIDELAAYGKYLGMQVEVETVGNWFSKTHYIKSHGTVAQTRRFVEAQLQLEQS